MTERGIDQGGLNGGLIEKAPPSANRGCHRPPEVEMTESMADDRGLNPLILNPNLKLTTRTRLLMAET